jgi:large subunit ribosomal protein L18
MKSKVKRKRLLRLLRHKRVRKKIFGTASRPRLSVFKSNKHIWVQVINDEVGHTLCSASDLELKHKNAPKTEMAKKVGELIAKKMKDIGIKEIVFDRGGFKYHGIVKNLAEALRQSGIKF